MYLMSGTRLATGRGFSPCIYWSSPPIMKFNQIIKLELSTNNAIKSISNECFDNTHTCSLKAHEAKINKKKKIIKQPVSLFTLYHSDREL